MRNSILFFTLLQAFLAFAAATPFSPLESRTACGEFETVCGNGCCGELIGYCADASKSLCCEQGQVEMDGICCWTGGSVTNGVCCPAGQENCSGTCCPGFCFARFNPIPIKIPFAKRNTGFCIATQAGCKTIENASGQTCGASSDCTGGGSFDCEHGCCIKQTIIHK
jgi:hypothetical protein